MKRAVVKVTHNGFVGFHDRSRSLLLLSKTDLLPETMT